MIKTLPITEIRANLTTFVDKAKRLLDEYVITVNGKPTAVLMSVEEYESLKETLEIMSDPGLISAIKEGEEDIRKGRVQDWENVKKELGWNV